MKSIVKFFEEVKLELSRVVWPKYDEFVGSTIVVVLVTTVMSLYLWAVDKSFDLGMNYLLGWWAS